MASNPNSTDDDSLLSPSNEHKIPDDVVIPESEPFVISPDTPTNDIISSLAASELLTPAEAAVWVHMTHNKAGAQTVADILGLRVKTVRRLNERATRIIDAASQLTYVTNDI